MRNITAFLIAFLLISNAYSFSLFSDSELTEYWSQSDQGAGEDVDHDVWDDLLKRYLSTEEGINFFNYSEMTAADKQQLNQYIERLQGVVVTKLNPAQQYAYWVNLYNAVTVRVILEHYPVDSITEISYSLISHGPWKEDLVVVEGMDLSLDDIEHNILRPIFKDNRIHYAVNCASIGCPNLQDKAYTEQNLQQLLDQAAVDYINHPRGASIIDGELVLSSIYDWYAEDFGDNDVEVIMHLKKYANSSLKQELNGIDEIEDYQYDWNLNE